MVWSIIIVPIIIIVTPKRGGAGLAGIPARPARCYRNAMNFTSNFKLLGIEESHTRP